MNKPEDKIPRQFTELEKQTILSNHILHEIHGTLACILQLQAGEYDLKRVRAGMKVNANEIAADHNARSKARIDKIIKKLDKK